MTENDLCECPRCGRMHKSLGFGEPPHIRDEIAELRAQLRENIEQTHIAQQEMYVVARDEALEQAARECFKAFGNKPDDYAAAIRALRAA